MKDSLREKAEEWHMRKAKERDKLVEALQQIYFSDSGRNEYGFECQQCDDMKELARKALIEVGEL